MRRLAILSGGTGWHVQDLVRAAREQGLDAQPVDFRRLTADSLAGYDAALVRTIPAGSLEQIVFRMDVLHAFAATGRPVLNPPRAVETCVDKHLTDVRLRAAGLPVPDTVVCQTADDALAGFEALGGDVVVKPLFGAEGRGMVRVTDRELAWRTFRAIEQTGGVLYLQRFVRHPGWDVRAFVIGGRVVAAMKRSARGDWRTNVAQGGTVEPFEIGAAERRLALRAAEAVGALVAGVDLLPGPSGQWYVIEVNAVPGWRALSEACRLDVAAAVVRYLVGGAYGL
ncbi:MAG: RimK family alpha-L-glutamate ligase [Gemmataceae bacterium]